MGVDIIYNNVLLFRLKFVSCFSKAYVALLMTSKYLLNFISMNLWMCKTLEYFKNTFLWYNLLLQSFFIFKGVNFNFIKLASKAWSCCTSLDNCFHPPYDCTPPYHHDVLFFLCCGYGQTFLKINLRFIYVNLMHSDLAL
jgi:hypothetical protein